MKELLCDCCGNRLSLYTQSAAWKFYRCPNCGFWTSRDLADNFPAYDYSDDKTFDHDADKQWDSLVDEAVAVMRHKFSLLYKQDGTVNGRPHTGETAARLKFLDIGCSEGPYVAACQQLGWDAYGFEIDRAKVDRAKARGLHITEPDYDDPIYQRAFDFIMLRHSLEHIPNFMDILRQVIPLLKDDGILCIETPNQESLKASISGKNVQAERFLGHLYPPTHINAFCLRAYRAMAEALNLTVIKHLTYSPADPNWVFSSQYTKTGLTPLIHQISAKAGKGENIAVFFRRNPGEGR